MFQGAYFSAHDFAIMIVKKWLNKIKLGIMEYGTYQHLLFYFYCLLVNSNIIFLEPSFIYFTFCNHLCRCTMIQLATTCWVYFLYFNFFTFTKFTV